MKDTMFWLAGQFAGRFAVAFQSLTGLQVKIDAREAPSAKPRPDDLVWRQPVIGIEGACMWLTVPQVVWSQVGRQILEASGLDDISEEDARSSFHELIQQSTAPLGQLISMRLQREVNVGPGVEETAPPTSFPWFAVPLSANGENWPPLLFSLSPELLSALSPPAPSSAQTFERQPDAALPGVPAPAVREARNLELLMEVEMPVGVSFGRTRMRLKDAIKLTTGSIVELNRAISEPVEVIVNNCVIARGEVVVVEGNYGIRIQQIVSREERLRTLF